MMARRRKPRRPKRPKLTREEWLALERKQASVLALTEDSQITKMVRVCGHEDAGMHLAVY